MIASCFKEGFMMFVDHVNNLTRHELDTPGVVEKVVKQVLVGPDQGWQGWVMRLFAIGPHGYTPRHAHPWPHINYVVSGKGVLFLNGREYQLQPGSVAYVPDNIEHQFQNPEQEELSFICIVPEEGDK
jgi:quercetin dioxygenase-like cupin family protein